MNTEEGGLIDLPELSDTRIDEIETALFAAISADRQERHHLAQRERMTQRARRRRIWTGVGVAAGVLVLALALAPNLSQLGVGVAGSSSGVMADEDASAPEAVEGSGADDGAADDSAANAPDADIAVRDREIITTASAAVEVQDASAAATRIGEIAVGVGGYVEAMSTGADGQYVEGPSGAYYPQAGSAYVSVRVPASELSATLGALDEIGEVTSSQIDRRDVTSESVDLRARIEALQASIDRLTELMGAADSTAALLDAENALTARQAELESYQQQLNALDERVALSTLSVTLTEPAPVVEADPAGFADGLLAGWSGLVSAVNGLVVALGFLLPWLVLATIVVVAVWAVRRAVRARKGTGNESVRDHQE